MTTQDMRAAQQEQGKQALKAMFYMLVLPSVVIALASLLLMGNG